MQALLKPETELQQDSRSTELLIRKWLVIFGSLFNREITPFLIGIWCELLSGLSAAQIEQGCEQVAKTWTFNHFPTPGVVLSQFDKAEQKGLELEGEHHWERLLDWVRENYFPDTGIRHGAPQLSPATLHAAKAAGGFAYIERCPQDQLAWCRKTFLAAYKNVYETEHVEHLLSDGEAKTILSQLIAGPPALPSANPDWEEKYPSPAAPQNLPSVAVVKAPPEASRVLTEEEWKGRRQEQKDKAFEWLATHPEIESK